MASKVLLLLCRRIGLLTAGIFPNPGTSLLPLPLLGWLMVVYYLSKTHDVCTLEAEAHSSSASSLTRYICSQLSSRLRLPIMNKHRQMTMMMMTATTTTSSQQAWSCLTHSFPPSSSSCRGISFEGAQRKEAEPPTDMTGQRYCGCFCQVLSRRPAVTTCFVRQAAQLLARGVTSSSSSPGRCLRCLLLMTAHAKTSFRGPSHKQLLQRKMDSGESYKKDEGYGVGSLERRIAGKHGGGVYRYRPRPRPRQHFHYSYYYDDDDELHRAAEVKPIIGESQSEQRQSASRGEGQDATSNCARRQASCSSSWPDDSDRGTLESTQQSSALRMSHQQQPSHNHPYPPTAVSRASLSKRPPKSYYAEDVVARQREETDYRQFDAMVHQSIEAGEVQSEAMRSYRQDVLETKHREYVDSQRSVLDQLGHSSIQYRGWAHRGVYDGGEAAADECDTNASATESRSIDLRDVPLAYNLATVIKSTAAAKEAFERKKRQNSERPLEWPSQVEEEEEATARRSDTAADDTKPHFGSHHPSSETAFRNGSGSSREVRRRNGEAGAAAKVIAGSARMMVVDAGTPFQPPPSRAFSVGQLLSHNVLTTSYSVGPADVAPVRHVLDRALDPTVSSDDLQQTAKRNQGGTSDDGDPLSSNLGPVVQATGDDTTTTATTTTTTDNFNFVAPPTPIDDPGFDALMLVKGLPFVIAEPDVEDWFRGYQLHDFAPVSLLYDQQHQPTGDAYVRFRSRPERDRAMRERQYHYFHSRWVQLFKATPEEYEQFFLTGYRNQPCDRLTAAVELIVSRYNGCDGMRNQSNKHYVRNYWKLCKYEMAKHFAANVPSHYEHWPTAQALLAKDIGHEMLLEKPPDKDKGRAEEEARRSGDRLLLDQVDTGMCFEGRVVALRPYGCLVDCGVAVRHRWGGSRRLRKGGLLHRKHLPSNVGLASDEPLFVKDKELLLDLDMLINVFICEASYDPTKPEAKQVYSLTLDPSVTTEKLNWWKQREAQWRAAKVDRHQRAARQAETSSFATTGKEFCEDDFFVDEIQLPPT